MQPIQGVFLFLTAVVLLQAVPGHGTMIEDPRVEREVLHKYPGLFHTKQEIDEHMANLLRSSPTRRVIPWIVVLGAVTYNAAVNQIPQQRISMNCQTRQGKSISLFTLNRRNSGFRQMRRAGMSPTAHGVNVDGRSLLFSSLLQP